MEESLLEMGTMLMIAGMGTVFGFLTILVGAMSLLAAVVRRLQPAAPAASRSSSFGMAARSAGSVALTDSVSPAPDGADNATSANSRNRRRLP